MTEKRFKEIINNLNVSIDLEEALIIVKEHCVLSLARQIKEAVEAEEEGVMSTAAAIKGARRVFFRDNKDLTKKIVNAMLGALSNTTADKIVELIMEDQPNVHRKKQ